MPRPTIRERLARWLAPGAESRSDMGGYGPTAGLSLATRTLSGDSINARTALSISAVWAAVNCYTNTLGSLDWYVAEKDDRGGRRPAPEHPAYDLLWLRPNRQSTSMRLRQAWVGHACTVGNGYLEIERDARDRDPVALHLMDPRGYRPVHRDGETSYRPVAGGEDLRSRDVLHLAMFGWDGLSGYSPIEVARETLGVAAAQRDYQAGLFNNSAAAQGHIEIPGNMKATDVGELRRNWNRIHQGPAGAGAVGFLEGGLKWVQTNFSPQDAEIILGCKLSVEEVARFFCLPQHKLNLLDNANFSTVEQMNLDFYTGSILPWINAIEQECDTKLIREPERVSYFTTLDVSSLLRADTAATTAQEVADLASGVRSLNEVRIARGLAPIDDPRAGFHWIPVNNLQALEDMGTAPDAGTGEAPATGVPPVEDVQAAALNGAQIASLLTIVSQIAAGLLPPDAARGIIAASFPTLSPGQLDAILGPLDGFTPRPVDPPAGPVDPPPAPTPPVPDATEGRDDPTASRKSEVLRDVLAEPLRRMIRGESRAARRAARSADFGGWLDAFHGPHSATVAGAIGPAARACGLDPAAVALALADDSRRQLRDLMTCVPPDELPGAVDRLCSRWEDGRAEALASDLTRGPETEASPLAT